ncbi:TRAP transporter substrate-binding protein [Thermus neutrinimicus]|uniref:TRAP transporter substrate-binding protein n=1 Tax=Thermus neutrinimicus TaxID=2908149 RepID=UPI001FAA553C
MKKQVAAQKASKRFRTDRRTFLKAGITLGAATLSGQAVAQRRPEVRWTMATSWPATIHLHHMAQFWAKKVEEMSGGRMVVDVQPSGAIVGAFEVLDAAHSGVVQAMHSWSAYWIGRNPAAAFFASVPFLFAPLSHLAWVYEGGGLQFWQKIYDDLRLNVKVLPCGITHAEIVAWSHKPLRRLEDWRSLKYRAPGIWGEILRGLGVAVVTLPAAELYTAMERRVIDATEFNTPYTDYLLRFHEVARYFTGPGMHQPTVLFELVINKTAWDRLPSDLKVIVEEAARATTLWSLVYDLDKSMEYIDLFKRRGNQQVSVERQTQWEIYKVAMEYLKKQAEANPFFKQVLDSALSYHRRYAAYDELMTPIPVREAHRVPQPYRVI